MAKKILIPPGRSNVDELDYMIYRYGSVLQTLTRCSKIQLFIFHFLTKLEAPLLALQW